MKTLIICLKNGIIFEDEVPNDFSILRDIIYTGGEFCSLITDKRELAVPTKSILYMKLT